MSTRPRAISQVRPLDKLTPGTFPSNTCCGEPARMDQGT